MGNSLKLEARATMETEIKVHKYSSDPDEYWRKCFKDNVKELTIEQPSSVVSNDKVQEIKFCSSENSYFFLSFGLFVCLIHIH